MFTENKLQSLSSSGSGSINDRSIISLIVGIIWFLLVQILELLEIKVSVNSFQKILFFIGWYLIN